MKRTISADVLTMSYDVDKQFPALYAACVRWGTVQPIKRCSTVPHLVWIPPTAKHQPPPGRICSNCGGVMIEASKRQRFCTPQCAKEACNKQERKKAG